MINRPSLNDKKYKSIIKDKSKFTNEVDFVRMSGGIYKSGAVTLESGQATPLLFTDSGRLKVDGTFSVDEVTIENVKVFSNDGTVLKYGLCDLDGTLHNNITKIAGEDVSAGSGDVEDGTLRVTIADDDTNLSSIKTNISDIKDIFEGGIPSGSSKVMPTVLEEVRGEEHTFEEGEAGTSVIFRFNNRPILNSAGNDVGKFGDSSFRWKQKSIFSDEVPFDTSIYEDIDTKLPIFISTLNEGEYAIDYSNGVFIGVKATSGTSDTCSYEIEKLNVVGSGGDGGGGEVNLTEIDGNTVSTGSGDSGKGTLRVVIANDDLNLSSINTKLNDVIKVEGKVYLGDNVVLPTAPITIPVDYVNERILQFSSAGRIDVAEPNKVYEIPTPPAINDGTTRSMMFEMVIGVSDISDPATGGVPSEPVFPIVKIYRENTLSGEEPTTTEIDTEIFVAPSVVLLPLVHTWSSDKYMLSSNMTAKFYYRIRGAYYLPK